MNPEVQRVRDYLVGLQARITGAIAKVDGNPFVPDPWKKGKGETLQGDGITMILEEGGVMEREPYPFTPEEWESLSPELRNYIHYLETRCDPAGDLRAMFALRAQRDELLAENELLRRARAGYSAASDGNPAPQTH